jgi:hypothetical protein
MRIESITLRELQMPLKSRWCPARRLSLHSVLLGG